MKCLVQKFLKIFSAPRYVLSIPFLNKFGLQELRIFWKLRQLNRGSNTGIAENVLQVVRTLERDGVSIINDFLSHSELDELHSEIERLRKNESTKFEIGKEGGDLRWEHGNFCRQKGFSLIERKFRNNPELKAIVENYTKRKMYSLPEVIYQNLSLPEGLEDADDVQTVLHADRYYRTLKMFYMVSDHTPENGAFWFSSGSQVMDKERIVFEKDYSYRSSLEVTGRRGLLDQNLLKYGRSTLHPDLRKKFPPKQICGKKNTLMIVDVSGFHKRGLINGGGPQGDH